MPLKNTGNSINITMYSKVQLPYNFGDLSPVLGEEAVREHYDVHYSNYTKGLNEAYLKYGTKKKLITILKNIEDYPKEFRENGGGYINHSIFFQSLKPIDSDFNEIPDSLQQLMIRDFGSADEFMNYFIGMGKRVFGSGWVWWCLEPNGKTSIVTTKNQDTPYAQGLYPLLGVDVWEHSYYLDYKANRLLYLNEIFRIINWEFVVYRIKNKLVYNV
jgi:Fe-Mn family superoxide dismutase